MIDIMGLKPDNTQHFWSGSMATDGNINGYDGGSLFNFTHNASGLGSLGMPTGIQESGSTGSNGGTTDKEEYNNLRENGEFFGTFQDYLKTKYAPWELGGVTYKIYVSSLTAFSTNGSFSPTGENETTTGSTKVTKIAYALQETGTVTQGGMASYITSASGFIIGAFQMRASKYFSFYRYTRYMDGSPVSHIFRSTRIGDKLYSATKAGSKIFFWTGVGITGIEVISYYSVEGNSDPNIAIKGAVDIGIGALGVWSGPYGLGISLANFVTIYCTLSKSSY